MLLAGPALASGALMPLDEMVQAALAGRLAGTTALAALGVCSSVFMLILKLFTFLDTQTTSRVAAANSSHVSQVLANAIFTAMVVGGAIALGMQFGSTWLLSWLQTKPALLPACLPYLHLRALAAPLELVQMAAQGALRGCRDMVTPALANVFSFVLSNFVGFVLMHHFQLGLYGLAYGRLAASALSCVLLLHRLIVTKRLLWWHVCTPPPLATLKDYVRSASALFARSFLVKVFFTAVAVKAGTFGTAIAAAHVIARQTASLFSITLDALAVAAQALIATHLGRDPRLVMIVGKCAHRAALVVAAVMALILHLFTSQFVSFFTTDDAVHDALGSLMPFFCALQPIAAPAYIFDGIFLGASDFDYMARAMGIAVATGFGSLHALLYMTNHGFLYLTHADAPNAETRALVVLWLSWGVHVMTRSLCFGSRFVRQTGPFAPIGITRAEDITNKSATAYADASCCSDVTLSDTKMLTIPTEGARSRALTTRQTLHTVCKPSPAIGSRRQQTRSMRA